MRSGFSISVSVSVYLTLFIKEGNVPLLWNQIGISLYFLNQTFALCYNLVLWKLKGERIFSNI